MDNIEQYRKLMFDWCSEILIPHMDEITNGKEVDLPEREFIDILHHNFYDIMETYEALELSGVLLSVKGPRSNKVSEDKYCRYVINTYLQDMYILKERLNSYATKIKRIHNNLGRNQIVDLLVEPVFDVIKSSFQGIVDTRGGHVHQRRYTDDILDDASLFSSTAKSDPKFSPVSKVSLELLKEEWGERINKNNAKVKELLNYYFACLYGVIQENQKVIVP
ncbi:hypothetical protein [Teredinibacter franksiae]|uniref:hypothetical protein n=1 Tax=Teredinibacter franksiae TaxID=2761453 RepID=UPI00162830D6|nr:hypothetical protein [Teredinibacter franksiae]